MHAEIKTKEVETLKTIIVKEQVNDGVTLHLANEEAAALMVLCGKTNKTNHFVGTASDRLYWKMRELGFLCNYFYSHDDINTKDLFGDLNFQHFTVPKTPGNT